jgi:hypothetical protein
MKSVLAAISIGVVLTLVSCSGNISSGPGTATAKWEEYSRTMQTKLDRFSEKCVELKDRAAKAEGQTKVNLDAKLEEAKSKRDAAAVKLDELKLAGADRWEKVKDGVESAFDDLTRIFE